MKRLGALVLVLAAGPCAAQQFYVPDTISEAAQAELRKKKSPALRPPYPAASDLPAWKRIFEEREASLASENAEVVPTVKRPPDRLWLDRVIKEQIFEVFQITRLDKFFKIVKDEQDAIKLF